MGIARDVTDAPIFLATLYLDQLNRSPLKWEAFPCVRVWTTKLVIEAWNDDRHGGYDVAYGEHHPLSSRDTMGPNTASRSMAFEIILNGMGIEAGCGAKTSATPLYDLDEAPVEKPTKRRRTGPTDGRYFRRGDNVRKCVDELIESDWDYSSSSDGSEIESEVEGEIEGRYYVESKDKQWSNKLEGELFEESEDKDWDSSDSDNEEGDSSSIEDDDSISLEEDDDVGVVYNSNDARLEENIGNNLQGEIEEKENEDGEENKDNVVEKSKMENIERNLDGQVDEMEHEKGNDVKNDIKGNDGNNQTKVDGEEIDETNGEKLDGNKGQRLSYISDGDGEDFSSKNLMVW
ncbi:Replicase polyprotein 1a [Bienertia sinuspersici]